MKTLLLAILLCPSVFATQYFLATAADGGSDANNGLTAGAPWLTLNHAGLDCMTDSVTAKASLTYAASNFTAGLWGAVTCTPNSRGYGVVMVNCETWHGCKIAAVNTNAMKIGSSYWGIQGWWLTTSGTTGSCVAIQPTSGVIHHFVIANTHMDGCISSGITTANTGTTAGVDYVAAITNIIWNAAQTTAFCDSGITIYQPIKSDSAPGTHFYIAGNFPIDNVSGTGCAGGGLTYDGEGIALDTLDFSQGGGTPYDQQVTVEHNLSVFNGGYGIATTGGGNTAARVIIRQNTLVGNMKANPTSFTTCGDLVLFGYPNAVKFTQAFGNLVQTGAATACSGPSSLYAAVVLDNDATDHVFLNWLYSAAGNNTQAITSTGFAFGPNNTTGTSPAFANPVDPGQPDCTGKTSVPHCMATVIANFTPTTAAALPYGRKAARTDPTYNPFFPQWLCNVALPTGLISNHCVTPGRYRR